MASPGRLLVMVLVATVVSLAMVLVVTNRMLPANQMPELWERMVIFGLSPAPLVREWFGASPPSLVRDLAVTWWKAQPLTWWWLPALVLLARWLVLRLGRRRKP
mgnify:CR=1 FL=1